MAASSAELAGRAGPVRVTDGCRGARSRNVATTALTWADWAPRDLKPHQARAVAHVRGAESAGPATATGLT